MPAAANSQFSLTNLQQLFNQRKIIGGPDLSSLFGGLGISETPGGPLTYGAGDQGVPPGGLDIGTQPGSEISGIGAGFSPNLSELNTPQNQNLLNILTNPSNWQSIQQWDQPGQGPNTYYEFMGPSQEKNQGPQAGQLPQTIDPRSWGWVPPAQMYGMQPQAPGTAISAPAGGLAYREGAPIGTPTAPSLMGPLDVTVQPPPPQPGQQPGTNLPLPAGRQQQLQTAQPQSGANWQANLENNLFVSRLPRYQEGGIVTSPTVALVGEAGPEAIVPLSGNEQAPDALSFLSDPFAALSKSTQGGFDAAFAPLKSATAAPTDNQVDRGLYSPQAPNLIGQYKAEESNMENLLRSYHAPDENMVPHNVPEPVPLEDTTAKAAPPPAQKPAEQEAPAPDYHDRVVGNGTTWGLDYEKGSYDAMDENPQTAFGFNAHNKDIEGASLPINVIKQTIGDYTNDPNIREAIKRGDYHVAVSNESGVTKTVPIIDAGPAEWTGNAIDLTYKTSHDLNTGGKAKVGFSIIGPHGESMQIRGYHPGTISDTTWEQHINNGSRRPTPAGGPTQEETNVAVKEALGRNQWASTEQGVPAGYKPPQEAAVDTPSVSFSKTAEGKTRDIRTIVMHSGDGTREGDINNLTQGNVSAHYYVNRDGTVQHFVPENDVAYHAGKNIDDSRYSNQVTLGIEQEHVDGKQDWPDAQVRGAAKLVSQIMERHPGLTIDDVVGHSTIAPERKQDPLDYPWDNFKKYVQEDLKGTPGATVAKTEEQPEETRTAAAKEPEEKEPVEEVAQAQPRRQLPKIATPTYQRPQTQAVLAKMIKEKSPVKSSEELPAFA